MLVTLLPWVIPPIALVVGVAATFRATVPWFLASDFSLVPFYALWAMPFTYRALDAGLRAISARTLYEAARSMGISGGGRAGSASESSNWLALQPVQVERSTTIAH